MHYHLEIIMPPTDDVEAAVEEILAPFDENHEDDEDKSSHPFWDFWGIGRRYSGEKLLALLGKGRLNEFYKSLTEAKVTVSGLRFGKQTLKPESQSATVDTIWNAIFPDSPIKECPIFDNYKGDFGDVMRLGDVLKTMECEHLIVAALNYKEEGFEAVFMVQETVWNGVTHIQTVWDKTIAGGLAMAAEKMKNYKAEYAAKRTPTADWLCVTVDYHS